MTAENLSFGNLVAVILRNRNFKMAHENENVLPMSALPSSLLCRSNTGN